MISVGSRDGRKGMGLGFEVPREMEETELEEGEACSFPDDDPSVDPDIALSYIDEKIQDVLGHFQKDFEGGVSAENLGAKFGGYGSFLPTYQRSPLWSHPRSPASCQIRNTHSSPNNLKMEGGRLNSVVPSSAPQKRLDLAPSNAMSFPAVMKPFANDMAKSEVDKIPSDSAQEFTSRPNHMDQKTLKVRIKVGSDNLMTQKNAEIYSGLGLDDSPSLSLDESPTESECLPRVPQALESSPTSILQIMTSFPVYGDHPLTPISEDLLCLTEKKCLREIQKRPFTKNKQDIPNGFGNGVVVPSKGDQRILGNRKIKPVERKGSPVELENGNKDTQNETGVEYNKKVDVDLLGCEEIVLKASKPPLLVNSYNAVDGTEKSAVNPCDMHREANKAKDKSFSVLAKEELQDPMATEEVVSTEQPNGKSASAVKVWENIKPNSLNDASVCGWNDGDRKAGRAYDSIKAESNASKGKKVSNAELLDLPKQKGSQKVISHGQESLKEPFVGKEVSSSIGKKKSKGSQVHNNPVEDMLKESWRADPSSLLKHKKGTHGDNCLLKSELGASKIQKAIRTANDAYDRYKDIFGDMNIEDDEYEMDSVETPYDGQVNSEFVEKCTSGFNSGSRDKMSSKKNDKASKSEYVAKVVSSSTSLCGNGPSSEAAPSIGNGHNGDAFPIIRNGPNFDAPPSGNCLISDATIPNGNGPNSDVIPAVVAPAGIEEKDGWVCCDKCQKWRLLPIGTNPDDLPEKWLCIMLNWLPGMNRCSVSEEETTNALTQRYQVLPTGSQNYLHGHGDTIVSTVNVEDVRLLNQSRQNDCFHGPANGKKKKEFKEMTHLFDQCAAPHFSNSTKKHSQALMKSKNLYDVNQLASTIDPDFQQSSKSIDLHSEKQRLMLKEKHKVIEQSPCGGDTKKIKVKSRWEIDPQDCSSDIKKFKDGIQNLDEEQISNHIGANDKGGPSSSCLETDVTVMDRPKHSGHSSSVDLKCDVKDDSQHSARKLKNGQATMDDKEMLDSRDATKKRKVKDSLESKDVLKELSENDKGKGKKARLLKLDAKEPNGSKASTKTDKNDDCIHQSLDGMDPLKKDLGSVQPSVATTSSSSKVSGSHKTKVNILELKGSPVESVSSSPLRISIPDKPTSVRRNAVANGSPRRFLDSEDDRSGRSERSKNNRNAISTHHRSFESPMLDTQERDHSHLTCSKSKQLYFSELKNSDMPTHDSHTLGHDTQCSSELQALDYFHNEEINHENHCRAHGSHLRKSGKGSSSTCSKDNDRSYKSEFDNGKTRICDSSIDCLDHAHSHQETTKERKRKSHEKTGLKYAKTDNISAGKKLKLSSGNNKRENRSKFDEHNLDVKVDGICSQKETSTPNRIRMLDRDGERSTKKFHSDKNNRTNLVSGRGSSLPLPPSGGGENEARIRSQKPNSRSQKGPGPDASNGGGDALVVEKQHHRKVDNQNGSQQTSSRQSTPSGQRSRALDARSPVRRDSSQEAPSLLKEATDLKHMADRLKNAGSYVESTGLYFQASLKFLHAASLMESGNIDGSKHAEMIQSMQIYSTTAKLFEFCAHEYEKLKDMAAAALACKCAEVAYMRVIYSSHNTANRDRHDLQVSLQMIAPGESPSSSASDVDNLNNPPTADKFAFAKGVGSPQVAGNHVIAARYRPNFMRLLTFTQNVNSAMEASRKSGVAFSAAKVHLEDARHNEGISSIKRALDYNFQDVEGLLRLVRLAMEAMSRG